MDIEQELDKTSGFKNLELLARQVVEGFISGMHMSPFHGFSAEFAEHRIYNTGESTRYVDWKLYAKTDKLYTKRYEEETNLRCHLIIDNSSSMHYPLTKDPSLEQLNKISFSCLAAATLMNIFKRQRDTVGLSIYSDNYDYYAPEKGSERHHQMLLKKLNEVVHNASAKKGTDTYKHLHLIAEKIHRRSMIFVFTDMFQTQKSEDELFEALRHLKYNKHEVIFFHVYDRTREVAFTFDNRPKRFEDVETGEYIDLYSDAVRDSYETAVEDYFYRLRLKCGQYRIQYVPVDIKEAFDKVLLTYLATRQKFA